MKNIPEIQAAAIVSMEGLPITAKLPQGMDELKIAAITAALLTLGDKASYELGKGKMERIYVRGEYGYIITISAGDNAVLTVSTTKEVKLGLIFLDMMKACKKIENIL